MNENEVYFRHNSDNQEEVRIDINISRTIRVSLTELFVPHLVLWMEHGPIVFNLLALSVSCNFAVAGFEVFEANIWVQGKASMPETVILFSLLFWNFCLILSSRFLATVS